MDWEEFERKDWEEWWRDFWGFWLPNVLQLVISVATLGIGIIVLVLLVFK